MTNADTLLVTGAGGTLGRIVLEDLLEKKAGPIIATTRYPEKLADFAARGVDVRKADFEDPATLGPAFAGADRLLLVSTDALDRPNRRLPQHLAAVQAAAAAGVSYIAYLSAPAPHPTPESSLIDDHFWTEQAIAATGLDFTFLRDHLYTDYLMFSLPHALSTGTLYTATGSGGRNYVTRSDCAHTAAAVLASGWRGRAALDVTGPAPVTQNELAALASELTGRPLRHQAIDAPSLRAALTAAGLSSIMVEGLVGFDVDTAEGFHAITTSVVKDWTGREPTSVRDYLAAHLAALAG